MERPAAFLAYLQNFDELHVLGRGTSFKPETSGEGRVLTLCINTAVNEAINPCVCACVNSEVWAFVDRAKLERCSWILTPSYPHIDGTPQSIMQWSDISVIRSRKNVCCMPVVGTYSRTTSSAIRCILSRSPHIRRVKLFGIARGRQMNSRFGRSPPISMDSLRMMRDEVDGILKQFDVEFEYC